MTGLHALTVTPRLDVVLGATVSLLAKVVPTWPDHFISKEGHYIVQIVGQRLPRKGINP